MSIDAQNQGSRDIVSRVKAILMSPKTEWPVIAAETTTVADLYKNYVVILAAIPAIALLISMGLVGRGSFGMGGVLTFVVLYYVMTLVGVYIIALVTDALAPTFNSTKDQMQALKTAAYSMTALWVASIVQIIPGLGALAGLVGLIYGLYLFYLGLPFTMKTPADKAIPYTAVVVVCALVIMMVLNMVVFGVVGMSTFAAGGFGSLGGPSSTSSNSDVTFDPNSPLGALAQYASKLEDASKNFESAQNSNDPDAQAKALGNVLGAVLGGGGTSVQAVEPDQLRGLVPERLGGLDRSDVSSARNGALGLQMSGASGTYKDSSGKSLELDIMDVGGTMGLMALAAWANIEEDKKTSTGFERTYRANNRIMHEVWNENSKHGELTVVTSNRFVVTLEGDAPNMDALKAAAGGVDLAALDRLGAAQANAR